jgi:flagellar basal-body rod protein FlgG
MFDALSIAATGMQAQQLQVDTIANNLVNMNTVAYKKARVGFADLMVRDAAAAGAPARGQSAAAGSAVAQRLGSGVAVTGISKVFEPGDLRKTDAPLDLAIQGEGFIEVTLPDGTRAFTRGGSLKVNADGLLATQAGHPLRPGLAIPANAQGVTITADGRVQVRLPNQSQPVEAGQIELVRFASAGLLAMQGDNLYRATEGSGEPVNGRAGEEGLGTLAQGFVEGSNVKMVDEFVSLMLAQRAYEAGVKIVQASDEMLAMVNNLRK